MGRIARTGVPPVLVALLGVALSGCGGGDSGPQLSRAAYSERASAECASLKRASDDLLEAQAPGATGAKVTEYLRRAADGLAELSDGLAALTPPDAIADDAENLNAALADYGDGLATLAGKVGKNETFNEALNSNAKLVAGLNDLAERATRLVATLGIDGCQLAA